MANNPYRSPVASDASEPSIRSLSASRRVDWMCVSFVGAVTTTYFVVHWRSRDVQEVAKDGFELVAVNWLPRGVAQDRCWFTLLGLAFSASLVVVLRRAARIRTPTAVVSFFFHNWSWLLIFLMTLIESWMLALQALSG